MKNLLFLFITLLMIFGCGTKQTDPNRPLAPPSGYMNETFVKISLGLGLQDLIETEPEVPNSIMEYKDIEYKNIDSISLRLNIYKRKDLVAPAPTLIFIHGGAWRSGKREDYLPYLIEYAEKGYVTATLSYRLVKQATFPAAVQDANCGVKWIKKHAEEYGIDPERIALVGGSAGAHLAMMIGYGGEEPLFNQECRHEENSRVKAVVNLYGPVDLTTPYAISTYQIQDFISTRYDKDPDVFTRASPRTYISPDDPPTLTFHGTIDSLVPVSQADSLDVWLGLAGVPHDYHRLKGWPHAMDLAVEVNEYVQFYLDDFLKKYL